MTLPEHTMATCNAGTTALIETRIDLEYFVASISPSSRLYVDLEGFNLSRRGTISLITILVLPEQIVRVIDVLVLGQAAFTTISPSGYSLQAIFEDARITKYFWDVRNDADALWALYRVGLAGVADVQLLENATRIGEKKYVRALDKCIQCDLGLGLADFKRWMQTNIEIRNRMAAGVFAVRPVDPRTLQYCANDVMHLPALSALYRKRATGDWVDKAMDESRRRVAEAHSPGYDHQSPRKALGPWQSVNPARPMTLLEVLDFLEDKREEALA